MPIIPEMLGDYFNDRQFRLEFQSRFNALWKQKDRCIDELIVAPCPDAKTGADDVPRFPITFPVPEGALFQDGGPGAMSA